MHNLNLFYKDALRESDEHVCLISKYISQKSEEEIPIPTSPIYYDLDIEAKRFDAMIASVVSYLEGDRSLSFVTLAETYLE